MTFTTEIMPESAQALLAEMRDQGQIVGRRIFGNRPCKGIGRAKDIPKRSLIMDGRFQSLILVPSENISVVSHFMVASISYPK